jgi:hypothetical protein
VFGELHRQAVQGAPVKTRHEPFNDVAGEERKVLDAGQGDRVEVLPRTAAP